MVKQKFHPYELLERIRKEKPLVHHLTNWVTIYDCASIVKAMGGSPVMAHAREEAAEMAGMAASLVLNIGTLTTDFVEAMKEAAAAANKKKIPVVLDACGAGATELRNQKCRELLDQVRVDTLKGNVSEIASLAGASVKTKGVDALEIKDNIWALAMAFANARACTVVVTGREDFLTDGKRQIVVKNGHPLMAEVVGTGCMAASVIGAFSAVEDDLLVAAACGLSVYEVAAECVAGQVKGPAAFKEQLIDALYALDRQTVERLQHIVEI